MANLPPPSISIAVSIMSGAGLARPGPSVSPPRISSKRSDNSSASSSLRENTSILLVITASRHPRSSSASSASTQPA
jgi:hypothetical protein